jgi:hypothetical protein
VALIRLGEAIKYNGNPMKALEIFNEVLEKCKASNNFVIFGLCHTT